MQACHLASPHQILCLSATMIRAISISANISTPSNHNSAKPPQSSTVRFLSKSGKLDEALRLIESSPPKSSDVDALTDFLHACISRKSVEHGQRLYLQLLLTRDTGDHNLLAHPTLKSQLITLFSVCGLVAEARQVFDHGPDHHPEPVWVAMAIGYSRNRYPKQALRLYRDMLGRYVRPGNFSFSMALKACADLIDLRVGRAVHAQILKSCVEPDQVVNNAVVRLYSVCGCSEDVGKMFDGMPQRNVVSWNSMISGFLREGEVFKSLEAIRRMQLETIGFSWVTLTTALSVCARATALCNGKEIHAQMVKSGDRPERPVLNSLLNMYAKCGSMEYCRRVFDGIESKDLTSWNTMLTGYAINRRMREAMELFDKMIECGIKPDGITFIALLSGCSHSGATLEGQRLFNRMKADYGVSPALEHYACLVDILGRAGQLEEAFEVVTNMPMAPSGSIWGSLLNSCRLHKKVFLAEIIAKRLFEIEPKNPGNYVMMSNIYFNAGMWDGVTEIRNLMRRKGIRKEAGCSWIQIKDRIHTFVAGGSFKFCNSEEYQKVSEELKEGMREIGYVPETDIVQEKVKAIWVCEHSERIAATFALINTAAGMPIRITKNLHVCVECHTWMKMVSRVKNRVIVLRDTNRFHHFENGACSCNDYW